MMGDLTGRGGACLLAVLLAWVLLIEIPLLRLTLVYRQDIVAQRCTGVYLVSHSALISGMAHQSG